VNDRWFSFVRNHPRWFAYDDRFERRRPGAKKSVVFNTERLTYGKRALQVAARTDFQLGSNRCIHLLLRAIASPAERNLGQRVSITAITRGRLSAVKLQRACTLCAVAGLAFHAGPAPGADASYPSRPIRIIDAFAAGGGTDIMARLIGQRLTDSLRQPIVVDNRPGAGGNVGAEIASKASPDGHTLFLAAVPALAPSATLYPRLSYNAMKDFACVTLVASGTYVLFVQPTLPVKSVADLIALAKAGPGKLSYGSTGVGGPAHLAGELFKSRAGVHIMHIASKGTPPILGAVSSGEVQMSYLTLAGVLPAWKAGRIAALAVTSAKRVKGAPDLPTIAESGLPGYDVTPWYGVLVPAGTHAAIVKRLNTEITAVLYTPDIQEKFSVQGFEATASSPEQFRRIMQSEIEKWAKVIRQAGIKAESS